MKKIFLFTVLFFIMILGMPAQAGTWNRLEKNPINVNKGKVFEISDAPYFIVGYSDFSNYSYSFEVILDGAEWNLPSSGNFRAGVYYSKRAANIITVSLDYGKAPNQFNSRWSNVYIPLACEITRSGEIYVSVDGKNSPVSSTKTLFARSIDGKFMPSMSKIASINDEGILGDVIISDTSTYPYKSGTLIMLQLDKGFEFVKAPKLTGTRKYEDNLRFFIDADDNSKAYIEILNTTEQNTGKIIASGIGIRRKASVKYAYRSVSLTLSTPSVTSYNGLDEKSISAAKFDENAVSELKKETEEETEKETEEKEASKNSEKIDPFSFMQGIL